MSEINFTELKSRCGHCWLMEAPEEDLFPCLFQDMLWPIFLGLWPLPPSSKDMIPVSASVNILSSVLILPVSLF